MIKRNTREIPDNPATSTSNREFLLFNPEVIRNLRLTQYLPAVFPAINQLSSEKGLGVPMVLTDSHGECRGGDGQHARPQLQRVAVDPDEEGLDVPHGQHQAAPRAADAQEQHLRRDGHSEKYGVHCAEKVGGETLGIQGDMHC